MHKLFKPHPIASVNDTLTIYLKYLLHQTEQGVGFAFYVQLLCHGLETSTGIQKYFYVTIIGFNWNAILISVIKSALNRTLRFTSLYRLGGDYVWERHWATPCQESLSIRSP